MLNATPLLRLYAKYRQMQLSRLDPAATQERELLSLLHTARHTTFGERYQFDRIRTVKEYQALVPLRTYEQFWNEFWKDTFPHFQGVTWPTPVRYIPVSSGTSSGTTKWIPYTREMEHSNTKAGLDLLVHHVTNRPKSQVFGGKSFVLGGSTDLVERAPGIYSGDLSGIVTKTLPWWVKARYFPTAEMALLKDWEVKLELLAKESLKEDIRTLSGVPNWLLLLCDRLKTLRPESNGLLQHLYPNLEMIVHGGVNFAPYYKTFQSLLEGSHAELREVYPASEGFIAVADRGYGEGLRLNLDHGIFFEFVPVEELSSKNPPRHWIANIEPEVNYAVVMSTCAGAWSYIIGDTVRFIDTKIPRVLITGRTSYYISAFGEHLIGEEVEDGVNTAANAAGIIINDYAMGALYPEQANELGRHLYVIEYAGTPPTQNQQETFITTLDKRLSQRNEDYDAHRQNDIGMLAPEVAFVPHGMFPAWMKSRGKLGGQNKVPRIITKTELFNDLVSFAREFSQQKT